MIVSHEYWSALSPKVLAVVKETWLVNAGRMQLWDHREEGGRRPAMAAFIHDEARHNRLCVTDEDSAQSMRDPFVVMGADG